MLDGQPEVLLDPNELSEDGTVALSAYAVSKDAKYLAYALSSSGSDWVTIKIMGVQDKKVYHDTLSWVCVLVDVRNCRDWNTFVANLLVVCLLCYRSNSQT